MLLTTLLAALQAPAPQTPARLHPADASFYMSVPDVRSLPEVYRSSALWRIATDPDLAEAVRELSDGQIDPAELLARGMSFLDPANMPPELIETGLVDGIQNLSAVSFSLRLPDDLAATVEPFIARAAVAQSVAEAGIQLMIMSFDGDLPETREGALELLGEDAELLTDPFGNPMLYELDQESNFGVVLTSLGADGAPGGTGADADVSTEENIEQAFVELLQGNFGLRAAFEFTTPEAAAEMFAKFSGQLMEEAPPDRVELGDAGDGFPAGSRLLAIRGDSLAGNVAHVLAAGSTVIFGGLRDDPREAWMQSQGDGASNLSTDGGYLAARNGLPKRGGATVYETYGTRSIALEVANLIDQLVENDAFQVDFGGLDPNEVGPQVAEFVRGIASEHPVAAVRVVHDGTVFVKDGFHPTDEATAKAGLASPKLDPASLAAIPVEASLVYASRMDAGAMARGLRQLLETVGSADPTVGAEAMGMLAGLEKSAGGTLEDRVLAHLGDSVLITSEPLRGLAIPGTLVQIPVRDEEQLAAGLTAWYESVAAAFPDDTRFKERDYRGATMRTLNLPAAGMIAPALVTTIKDGRLVMGLQANHIRDILRGPRGGDDEEPAVHALLAPGGGLEPDVHSALFVDLGAYFDGLYTAVKTLGSMAGSMMGGELPVDLTKLPDAEIVTRHLRPTLATQRWTERGLVKHSVGSFGPELLLAFGVVPAVGYVTGARGLIPQPDVSEFDVELIVAIPASPPDVSTREGLQSVRVGLEAYRYAKDGTYPATLDALSKAAEGYPSGFLSEGVELVDAWGNAFAFAPSEDGTGYSLYSIGPNGVDEGGEGDDLRP